jgi:hypothetical protein
VKKELGEREREFERLIDLEDSDKEKEKKSELRRLR